VEEGADMAKRKRTDSGGEIIVVVVKERRGFLKTLANTALGIVLSKLTDQLWALVPAPIVARRPRVYRASGLIPAHASLAATVSCTLVVTANLTATPRPPTVV
jgi:hypothetical protein